MSTTIATLQIVTGPRQSGKTMLCRAVFPHLNYVNLEAPNQRDFAESDPVGFLSNLGDGAILDEIQRVPDLLSYLQILADEKRKNSLFVLTGSEQFPLFNKVGQSLAGRVAILILLPFSLAERKLTGANQNVDEILYSGFYPRIYDQKVEPELFLANYISTYVERDVRQIGEIRNLASFRRFVRLSAGRVGQLLNLSKLGADAGVSHTTARHWLSILEASYIVFQLPPYFANIRKRLVKTPKIYFYDVGLASHLIGIENVRQIFSHPLRGHLFENAVIVEALKKRFNQGLRSNLSFYRDKSGLECDLIMESGIKKRIIDIKSGATVASDYFNSLNKVSKILSPVHSKYVVYGGSELQTRNAGEVIPFLEINDYFEKTGNEW